MNQPVIIIAGNIGKEPELRYTPEGKAVLSFSVALYTGKDKPPVWARITAWEDLAETAAKKLGKGTRVVVDGTPRSPRTYEVNGEMKSAGLEITASKIEVAQRENEDVPF